MPTAEASVHLGYCLRGEIGGVEQVFPLKPGANQLGSLADNQVALVANGVELASATGTATPDAPPPRTGLLPAQVMLGGCPPIKPKRPRSVTPAEFQQCLDMFVPVDQPGPVTIGAGRDQDVRHGTIQSALTGSLRQLRRVFPNVAINVQPLANAAQFFEDALFALPPRAAPELQPDDRAHRRSSFLQSRFNFGILVPQELDPRRAVDENAH